MYYWKHSIFYGLKVSVINEISNNFYSQNCDSESVRILGIIFKIRWTEQNILFEKRIRNYRQIGYYNQQCFKNSI